MAIRVSNYRHGFQIKGAYAVKLVDKIANDPELRARFQGELVGIYSKHADNAIQQVGEFLSKGMFPGASSASYPLNAKDGDGKPLKQLRTPVWSSLSPKYVRHKPLSTAFWNKRGNLKSYYGDATTSPVVVTVEKDRKTVRSHHKGKARLAYTLALKPTYHPVIVAAVLEPFVAGDSAATVPSAGFADGFRNTVAIMAFPEFGPYKRPFVAQLSAALGRRALSALRRL